MMKYVVGTWLLKIFATLALLGLLPACSAGHSAVITVPAAGAHASASELRRSVASGPAGSKTFGDMGTATIFRSSVGYSCDRAELPRTCCYYLITMDDSVHNSGLSCVEENH